MRSLLTLFIAVFFLLGCEKETDDAKTLLTAESWKQSTFEKQKVVNGIAGQWENIIDTGSICSKDNSIFYHLDGSLVETEGTLRCNYSQSDTVITARWALLSNDTELEFKRTEQGRTVLLFTYDINRLDKKRLQISRKEFSFDSTGTNPNEYYIYKFTYVH